MNKPTVSLIIATYNRRSRIARSVESVLCQTNPPDEIIVINDGSNDNTSDFIRQTYRTVKLFQIPNSGVSTARNTGAKLAQGSILIFLDDDDEMLPNAVESLTRLLGEFPEARAAFADHQYLNQITGIHHPDHHGSQPAFDRLRNVPIQRRIGSASLYDRNLYYALLQGNLLQQPWAIYKQDFMKTGGFAPGIRYEDWVLFTKIAHEFPLVLSDEVISKHHIEKELENYHLSLARCEQQIRATRLLAQAASWRDLKAKKALHRMIGVLHKTEGDRIKEQDLKSAWTHYLKSMQFWPFDHVVIARLLLWFPEFCLESFKISQKETGL